VPSLERRGGLAPGAGDRLREIGRRLDDPHAAPAAAGRRLDQHRVADPFGSRAGVVVGARISWASSVGTPILCINRLAESLSPIARIAAGGGPTKVRPAARHRFGEPRRSH
jgi:hypothetical protein